MLTIVEDTTSGVHDTLIAACDRFRYHELGVVGALEGTHRNCADNLIEGLSSLGTCSLKKIILFLKFGLIERKALI